MNSFRSFFFRNAIPSLREFLSSNEYFERSRTKFRRKGKEGAFRLKRKSNFKWLLYYCNSAHRSTRTSKYRSRAFSSRIDCIYSWAVILPPFSPSGMMKEFMKYAKPGCKLFDAIFEAFVTRV